MSFINISPIAKIFRLVTYKMISLEDKTLHLIGNNTTTAIALNEIETLTVRNEDQSFTEEYKAVRMELGFNVPA